MLDAARQRDLPLVCANPDLVVMVAGRPLLCAGAMARYYAEAGGRVCSRGKPDPAIYDTCLDRLGIRDRRRVLAVGDAFHTDVAGARAAGIDCLLCTGGIHAEEIGTTDGEKPEAWRVEAVIAAHGGLRPVAAIGGLVW
jgi:HAD superfamily hydrolase (TIGR01459 family)